MAIVGVLFCGIGVVVTMTAAIFLFLFMVEKRLDATDALTASIDLFKEHWFPLIVFAIICYLIEYSVGKITFGVGLLVSIPFAKCMVFVVYKQLVPAETYIEETDSSNEKNE